MRGSISVAVLAAALIAGRAHARPPIPVIMDHDGAVDDLVALSLLVASPQVRLRAVTVTPADSYLDAATRGTQLVLDRLGARGVSIAQGHDEGTHPFPAEWRQEHANILDAPSREAPAFKPGAPPANHVVAEDAPHHLVRLLSGRTRYVIVETGPLTNIADALRLKPSIRRNIVRLYAMGGAVRVKGNVDQPGHDGSAEWNFHNKPRAAAEVLASGIPITLVPLDATNRVPMTRRFVEQLAARPGAAARLAAQMQLPAIAQFPDEYYFWDPLTTAAFLDPSLVTVKTLKLKVIPDGPSAGRTVEAADGATVQVAMDADRGKVERLFLQVLGR